MAGAPEKGEDRPWWAKFHLVQSHLSHLREMEAGVRPFLIFVGAVIVGFLLALSGMFTLAAVLGVVAVISIVAMALRPSPRTLERRAAAAAPPEVAGEAREEGEEGKGEKDREREAREGLPVADRPAPPPPRRAAPEPPPEPPPVEDVVVVAVEDEVEVEVEDEAEVEGKVEDEDRNGDIWV